MRNHLTKIALEVSIKAHKARALMLNHTQVGFSGFEGDP